MRSARVAALVATTATILLVVPPAFAADRDAQSPDDVPGAVTIISARPGGGSGEIVLSWEAQADASGYRVLRSNTADDEPEIWAELDVTTGAATASNKVVNLFSDQHSYIPPSSTFEGPDQAPQFTYVELTFRRGCFRVIAFNAAGDGPSSDVACSDPRTGGEPEPPATTTTTVPPATTTTTDSPPTTTTTVTPGEPSITVPPAPQATPVPAQPSFTG